MNLILKLLKPINIEKLHYLCNKINNIIINREYTTVLYNKPTNTKCDWNFFNSPFFQYFKIGCSD